MKILLCFVLFSYCFARDDDSFIRNRFMPLAAAAYSDQPDQCLAKIQKHWNPDNAWNETYSVYRQYTYVCDSTNGGICSAYIAIDYTNMQNYGFIILAFRGTDDYDQKLISHNWNFTEMVPFSSGGKVGKYFFDAFNNIWNIGGMKDDVNTLKNKYPTYRFQVVGHSLGGAVASMAAATIISTGIAPTKLVLLCTFGEPRSGDKDYANSFITLQINATRIVHNRDPMPHYPSVVDLFYHHIREFWYPNDQMTDTEPFFECNSSDGEDPTCSNSLNGTLYNFDDHKNYFGRGFSYYGINGCYDL